MIRFGNQAGEPVTIKGQGEEFTFAGHAFIRIKNGTITARGDLHSMKIRIEDGTEKLVINGNAVSAQTEKGFLLWKK